MKTNYAGHYEVLMAVVTHLAVHKWALRQPKGIAKDVSLDVEAVRTVLKSYKGLFRESSSSSRDHGDPSYSLQLRHHRQSMREDGDQERPPLEPDYLFPLLKFVADKAAQESQQSTAIKVASLSSAISLLVAIASLVVAFHKV